MVAPCRLERLCSLLVRWPGGALTGQPGSPVFSLAVAVFRCSVNTFAVLVREWRRPTADGHLVQAFRLTAEPIFDYTVLTLLNEHGGEMSSWQVVK